MLTIYILTIDTSRYAFLNYEYAKQFARNVGVQGKELDIDEIELYNADVQMDNEGQLIVYTGIYGE